MEDGNCMFLQNSLTTFRMGYVLLIRWYNFLGVLKKEAVSAAENFVIICEATAIHSPQNRNIKVTTVNILCAILNHYLFLHECSVLCSLLICWLVEWLISCVLNSVGT